MDKINHCINHNRFIPVDSEELSALELIGKTVEKSNELIEKSNDHEERIQKTETRKVSYNDMTEKYLFTDEYGLNYNGKWQGLDRPTMSEEGLRATVEQIQKEIAVNIYKDITVTEFLHDETKTKYWITKIPYINQDGSKNLVKKGFSNDIPNVIGNEVNFTSGEKVSEFIKRKKTIMAINGGAFNSRLIGTQIKDGIVLQESEIDINYNKNFVLGITKENKLKVYNFNTPSSNLIDDGITNTFCFMTPIILNGQDVPQNIKDLYPNGYTTLANRQMIGQKKDTNDIYILTCEGRTIHNKGLNFQHCTDIMLAMGLNIAYALDGGGSTSLVTNGYLVNNPTEVTGEIKERNVMDYLYIERGETLPSTDITINSLEKALHEIKKEIIELKNNNKFNQLLQIHSESDYNSKGLISYENGVPKKRIILDKSGFKVMDVEKNNKVILSIAPNDDNITTSVGKHGNFLDVPNSISDCNSLKNSGEYWITNTCLNSPLDSSYLLKHIQINPTSAMQIAYPYSTSLKTKMRRTTGVDVWSAWREI